MKTADYVVQQRKLVLYVVLLGSLLSLGGCSGNPKTWAKEISPPVSLGKDERIVDDQKKGLDGYAGFNNALKEANQERSSISVEKKNNKNAALLTEGMNLIMGNCSRYFTALGNVGQDTSFIRKETTLAGTTVAALMGLADAGSKAISVTATAFGLTTATIDNFSDVYLFSPEIKNIQDLVIDALKIQMDDGNKIAKAAKLNPINDPLTYTEVIQLLFQMESTCQPHGIHQLINTAVANNKVVPKFEDSSVEKLESDVSEFEAKALAAKTKLQTLNKKVKSKENYIELNGNYENQLNSVFEFLSSAKSQAENEKADLEKEIKSLSAQNPNQTDEISKLNIKLANLELKKSINSDKLSDAEKKLTLFKSNRDNYNDLDSRAKTAKSVATTNTQYYENLSKQPEPPESSDKITYKYNLDSAKKIADDSNKAAKDTRDLADAFAENLIKPYRQEMKKSDSTLNRSLGYEVRAKN